ncbi:MAG: hypothetical protein WD646_13705 [Actinomycetota bacterium]
MRPSDPRFLELAERGHGVVLLNQDGKRLRKRALVPVHRGVGRVRGAPLTFEQEVQAASLAVPGAAASHRTAGWKWGLEGIIPVGVELIIPHRMGSRRPGIIVHRSRTLERSDITRLGQIPITNPMRTIIDLAGVATPLSLELALDDAYRRGLIRLDKLASRLELLGHGCRGAGLLRALLLERRDQPPTGSGLETKFFAALRSMGLPRPVRQHDVYDDDGRWIANVDFAYPKLKIAIEIDGLKWHIGRKKFESDHEKRIRLPGAGWYLLAFTQRMVEHTPGVVGAAVHKAFVEREGRNWV